MRGDVWFFERVAPVYDLVMPPVDRGALSDALSVAEREVERVVDVGGGTGRAVRAVSADDRVVVDASRAMLRRAPPGVDRVRATATALPIAASSVDAVLIVDALHHLPAVATVVAEAKRVLRPGGVLVVREFDRETLRGRLIRFGERALGFDSRFFSVDELLALLDREGLEPAAVERGFACTVAGRKPGGQ